MRFNIISIVCAVYLVSSTFSAPVSAPVDANSIVGRLGSGLTGMPQGVTVSSMPATSAAGVHTFGGASGYDDIPNLSANSKASESAAMKKKVDEMESSLSSLRPNSTPAKKRLTSLTDGVAKDNNVDAKDIKVL